MQGDGHHPGVRRIAHAPPGLGQPQKRTPFPVEEEVILELRFATQQSPSHVSWFLEAPAFMGYMFGIQVDVFSARARGIALQGL